MSGKSWPVNQIDHDSRTIDALIFDVFTLIARPIIEAPNNSGILRGFNYRTAITLRSSPKHVRPN